VRERDEREGEEEKRGREQLAPAAPQFQNPKTATGASCNSPS